MLGVRVLIAFPLGLLLCRGEDQPGIRHYRMYRNPPKPLLALLPVSSRSLDRPARSAFDRALAEETLRLKSFRILPLPEAVRPDSQGQLPDGSLPLLRERYGVDFVLQAKLEEASGRKVIFAELVDTRNGDIRAKYRSECRCPLEELIARTAPESIRRLATAPGLHKGRSCEEGMALIPAPFVPGTPEPDSAGRNWGPGAFCMDMYEFPNESAGEPAVARSWSDADSLCAGRGKRLCTEAEWELACGGWQGDAYPYGKRYDGARCNTESATIQLSGSEEGCRSPFGVYDLSGNVFEWTASDWSDRYQEKVVRGGNWSAGAGNSTCKARFGQPTATTSQAIGFRCCRNP
jgi:hypothetical protein